ncbi:hypothetical protein DNFV4_03376 [Nitrospira tepida]|uniref:Uncharacterized protein n=1 Tax=Nitrospira tepida TaxID=2973512 RepID=A0AA86N1W0_9BACT|nr:hypothetical protein [Nitrospira tepida]CAI4032946.1 hypothetical protein DNFV4_03376 [Nitrospira tepida]
MSQRIVLINRDLERIADLVSCLQQRAVLPVEIEPSGEALAFGGGDPPAAIIMVASCGSDLGLARLRSAPALRHVPILVISSCLICPPGGPGATAYFFTPVDPDEFLNTLDRALHGIGWSSPCA